MSLNKEEIWKLHKGKIIGIISGLLLSVLMLVFGFFKTVFIASFMIIGFFIGKKIDTGEETLKENFLKFLERILPNP
jgi:uncharacterized membrane protein